MVQCCGGVGRGRAGRRVAAPVLGAAGGGVFEPRCLSPVPPWYRSHPEGYTDESVSRPRSSCAAGDATACIIAPVAGVCRAVVGARGESIAVGRWWGSEWRVWVNWCIGALVLWCAVSAAVRLRGGASG